MVVAMVCKKAASTAEMMDSLDTTMVVTLVVSKVVQMECAMAAWKAVKLAVLSAII